MSLINKMLQDLDARHTSAHEATTLYTKPVARGDARLPVRTLAWSAAAVVALAVGGALGWHYWHKPKADAQPAQMPVKVVVLSPAAAPAKAVQAAPGPKPQAAPVVDAAAQEPAGKPEPAAHEPVRKKRAAASRKAEQESPVAEPRPRARRKADEKTARIAAEAKAPAQNTKAKAPDQGKEENPSQKAESSYRRALASLQDGYANDAIGALEDTLKANPKHDAARQTLVSLLIENRRVDEAMRQLQLGLTLDPRQPSMAMLLARLQIERGASGIETLMRTLPYAGSNADYHAFLAGALQRQQRHREAAEQYQAALQRAPQNGVWWMGLGISLQAEKRDAEAVDAYRKAKGTGSLSPELLGFVERKIQQLAR